LLEFHIPPVYYTDHFDCGYQHYCHLPCNQGWDLKAHTLARHRWLYDKGVSLFQIIGTEESFVAHVYVETINVALALIIDCEHRPNHIHCNLQLLLILLPALGCND
jgi:hypothetical protein